MSVVIDFSPQVEAQLTAVALHRGVDVTDVIERLVIDYLPTIDLQPETASGPSLYDRFKDVIGTVEGLPEDMSQDPGKYMGGFGKPKNAGTPPS